jgi:methyltransferase (TIGR00027 family)
MTTQATSTDLSSSGLRRPTGVSRTAVIVAQARADETVRSDRLFNDPHAQALVDAAGRIEGVSQAGKAAGGHFVLRTRFFDDVVTQAARSGCQQVVILGAGLDTRAYRLALPPNLRLFELDLPDLLSFKDAVLADRAPGPTCERTPVPIDLRDDWPSALQGAGFDSSLPTVWLVEGVLMYLPSDAVETLLDRLTGLSTSRDRLALEHANRAYMELPMMQAAKKRLQSTGAGWQSSVEDPVDWLQAHGWQAEVTSTPDLAHQHNRPVPAVLDPEKVGGARLWLVEAELSSDRMA